MKPFVGLVPLVHGLTSSITAPIQATTARVGSDTTPNATPVPKLQLPQTQDPFLEVAWEFPREGWAPNRQYQQYAYTENEVTRLASFVKQLPLSFPDDHVDEEFL